MQTMLLVGIYTNKNGILNANAVQKCYADPPSRCFDIKSLSRRGDRRLAIVLIHRRRFTCAIHTGGVLAVNQQLCLSSAELPWVAGADDVALLQARGICGGRQGVVTQTC